MCSICLAGTVGESQVILAILLSCSSFLYVLFMSTSQCGWLVGWSGAGQRTRWPITGPQLEHEVWQPQGSPLVSQLFPVAHAIYSDVHPKSSCSIWQVYCHFKRNPLMYWWFFLLLVATLRKLWGYLWVSQK